jgi:hypothetical protein
MNDRRFYELIIYRLLHSGRIPRLDAYLELAALPAYGRLGIGPVGVFKGVYGPEAAALFVLLPHPNLGSVAESRNRLLADTELAEKGADFLDATIEDPGYIRIESSLMAAFAGMPGVELPENNLQRPSRLFELRVYESHSLRAHKKKIAMFNEGGEIGIFRRTGLNPVFFGETLIGGRIPNLTYMLTFDDMARREEAWDRFKEDPEWHALRDDPQYADTVSNITDCILEPRGYSQM